MSSGATLLRVRVSEQLIEAFAELTGDHSSLHVDAEFSRTTRFRRPVMHGMLPLVYLAMLPLQTGEPARYLRKLNCRFFEPCFPGDEIAMTFQTVSSSDAEQVIEFSISRGRDGIRATEGRLEFQADGFGSSTGESSQNGGGSRLEENRFQLPDLFIGKEENFSQDIGNAIPAELLRVFRAHVIDGLPPELSPRDPEPNILPAFLLSAMVGMRLPGRYSTLSEISIDFTAPLSEGTISIHGEVERIMPASSRVKIGASWSQGGTQYAKGHAWVLLGTAPAEGISAESIREHSSLGIDGRVAIVTGSSRGIGEATAKLLAAHGAKVVVHYFRGKTAAEAIVSDIERQGGRAICLHADIRNEQEVETLFQKTESVFGPVEILVNNAVGEFSPKAVTETGWDDYLNELEVSLHGAHTCCRLALPSMKAKKWGKIVNVGSIAVDQPVRGQSKYITIKSALTGYTRSLALELAAENIQVNLVVPQMTKTSLLAGLPGELIERLGRESPSGGLLEPIDVARAIVFLASEWAKPISGQRLVLNQGMPPFL